MRDEKQRNTASPQPADASACAEKTRNRVKKKKAAAVFLLTFGIILVAEIFGYLLWNWQEGRNAVKQEIKDVLRSEEAMQYALTLKADYKQLALALKDQDPYKATYVRKTIDKDIAALRERMEDPVWVAARKLPAVEEEVQSAIALLDIAEDANTRLVDPLIEQLRLCPLSDLRVEGGVRVNVVLSYMDFAERMLPVGEELLDRMEKVQFSFVDSDGKLRDYTAKARNMLDSYRPYMDWLPALRMILGDGQNRLYLFAAQNTAEIRASGGFPGAMGMIRIMDGILIMTDFQTVYNVLAMNTPEEANVSWEEYEMSFREMNKTWDSDYCPDFERVAYIWSLGYEARNGETVDGVVSATPVIIQRVLGFLGGVTLSDGTELDGDNAMRVLGHDLYYRYQAAGSGQSGNDIVDALFAETAKKTLALLTSTAGLEHMQDYIDFFETSIADRTLMLWMADPAEQELIRQHGWAGTLNRDETRPVVGVFFNNAFGSKVGWYADIDPIIGDPVENADGSMTYPVTVSFTNTLGYEERDIAGDFILGGADGSMYGGMYIFGPAGGTADFVESSSSAPVRSFCYQDLDVIFLADGIGPLTTVTLSCNITTSPNAIEPLGLMQTPTAQNYR